MGKTITFYFTILFCFSCFNGYSCINEYDEDYTRLDGSYKHITDELNGSDRYYFYHEINKDKFLERKYELKYKTGYKDRTDYAAALLRLGEFKEALSILENLIEEYPNEYNIVVNLGTAYELNNNPELALKYISKAVKLNPLSHNESEWIHEEILKAKIALKTNPDYFKQNSILNLQIPHDIKAYYNSLNEEKKLQLFEIKNQLLWQLEERISLIAPPDPIVADLLFDFANLVAITESIEIAIPLYNQSLRYLPNNFNEILERRDSLIRMTYWTGLRRYAYLLSVISFLVMGAFFLIKREKKLNAKKELEKQTMDTL
ncbi:MAG: tetratricopeptide repeat protein [Sporocytophaga sp.]|uniref:tetratricopeptide repeat protein n=1 Tax=Sporocytophaga sp. TaxID=2231183 RepID=UPI001B1D0FA2|nr:tetratricopeptide repeat protein [Sporocytophaga sp.]MBO9699533.1 tetratricopeptide repeat protein [Sporocytophaga sp.]